MLSYIQREQLRPHSFAQDSMTTGWMKLNNYFQSFYLLFILHTFDAGVVWQQSLLPKSQSTTTRTSQTNALHNVQKQVGTSFWYTIVRLGWSISRKDKACEWGNVYLQVLLRAESLFARDHARSVLISILVRGFWNFWSFGEDLAVKIRTNVVFLLIPVEDPRHQISIGQILSLEAICNWDSQKYLEIRLLQLMEIRMGEGLDSSNSLLRIKFENCCR